MKTYFFRTLAAGTLILVSAFGANAQGKGTVLDLKNSISDSNIVYPESFESDAQKMLEGWYMKNYTAFDDRYLKQGDSKNDDATIQARLAALPTRIALPFNQIVRSYIDRYTQKGRAQVTVLLGLSNYYNPIFEQALEERNLPLELKYLPVIESGLNPNAVSKHGAAGLWQFMIATGKGLGMEVNSLVDERRDPYLSSKKAAEYLESLYNMYGDWSLAIAAYNCGPGSINKAIRRAGGDPKSHDFWSIYNYLTPETRGYVPAFIAANYVMNYYPDHNISPVIPTKPLVTDTLHISSPIHFNQISAVLDIPVEELRILNPQFRADMIPGSPEKQYTLILPSQQIHAYLLSENEIKNFEAEKYRRHETAEPGSTLLAANTPTDGESVVAEEVVAEATPAANTPESKPTTESAKPKAEATKPKTEAAKPAVQAPVEVKKESKSNSASQSTMASNQTPKGKATTHKVKPGETLASIASAYGVEINDIKGWNSLTRNAVRTGQMLKIYSDDKAIASNNVKESTKETAKTDKWSNSKDNSKADKENIGKKGAANDNKELANNTAGEQKSTWKSRKQRQQEAAEKAAKAKAAQSTTHTLKSGDNLSKLAKRYGVSIDAIKQANNMKDDDLMIGDKIKIPSKATKNSKGSKSSSSRKKRR